MTDLKHHPDAPTPDSTIKQLGYAPMDRIHAEFDELLVRAHACSDNAWLDLLRQIDAHLHRHFDAENQWMEQTSFPPKDCHIEEHAAVLKSSTEVLALAETGNFDAAPSFVAELARWFPGHADYLDSALAAWMCKRQYGGKPVVFHRKREFQ